MRKKNLEFIYKNQYEKASWSQGFVVCGIDEVGRGCLAGPVVTAAVVLPVNKTNPLLKDSKVMTPQERQKAYSWIVTHCWYSVGIVHNRQIDQHNIWQSTLIAMKKALLALISTCPYKPSAILVDAMPLQLLDTEFKDIPVHHFPFGERKSSSIAAASIVAKVVRDQLMAVLDMAVPGYGLSIHKGYATQVHRDAITQFRHSILHRTTFLRSKEDDRDKQQTIC